MSLQAAKMTPPVNGTMPPVALAKRRWGAPMNQPIQNWQGRRVWLVGASSGIGLACAKAMQAAGAHVIVSARDLGTLSEWAEVCKTKGLPVALMSLDVTDALQVKYAYAVTCHKSQGGQWSVVFVDPGFIPEDSSGESYYRWLYTAITRASERVYLVNFKDSKITTSDQ